MYLYPDNREKCLNTVIGDIQHSAFWFDKYDFCEQFRQCTVLYQERQGSWEDFQNRQVQYLFPTNTWYIHVYDLIYAYDFVVRFS